MRRTPPAPPGLPPPAGATPPIPPRLQTRRPAAPPPQVVKTATATMTAVCSVNGNRDLEGFLPIIIACIAKPAEVPDCIHKLAATVFVQEVVEPALAIMVPLLERGLRERQTAIKRKTAIIIDNMCKLARARGQGACTPCGVPS